MTESIVTKHPEYGFLPTEIEGVDSLAELALDLRWSSSQEANKIWRQLNLSVWELTHNPWVVLQTTARHKLEGVLADPEFRKEVAELLSAKTEAGNKPAWFQTHHPRSSLSGVAYFSLEYMLSEALPIYSGGLGNVAGDQLKAASDLGVPVVAVGLLYQQGYFRQVIDLHGEQQALYPYNDPGQMPITPLRQSTGDWLRLEIALPGYSVFLRAWQVQVGRVKLYLLDSNDAANFPAHRAITSELYGGGPELRLKQEMLLGIGGWRLLEALNLHPEVCHLNEGHAAFAVLERAHSFMKSSGLPFASALAITRAGNLFTTHTAVAAGFDRFHPSLIAQYLGGYAVEKLGISLQELLALGRENSQDGAESFNMAYLAIRGSGAVNGVSRLHGKVSRHLFEPLFPRWPGEEVPIGHVTNGVHIPTWISSNCQDLWTEACGPNCWLGTMENLENGIRRCSDAKLWASRQESGKLLVEYIRARLSRQLEASGSPLNEVEQAKHLFDPQALTLGFARRFAGYKRPNLLLQNPERLIRILKNTQCPVQLVMAGKAHPQDLKGQELIHEWITFIRQNNIQHQVVFLSDYDMFLTKHLVQGVDVWLNTPRRPWEACGTSGMKVLANGGLNLSELDGWWAEAFVPDLGWSIGDGQEHGADPKWDAAEAGMLYDTLEREVIPEFFNRDPQGVPLAWVAKIRESMACLTARFSAERTVREYTENHYLPAATAFRQRSVDAGVIGKKISDWQHQLNREWNKLRFHQIKAETREGTIHFEVEIGFNDLNAQAIRVELYAEAQTGEGAFLQEMKLVSQGSEKPVIGLYIVEVSTRRPAADFTPRIIPYFDGVSIPLEDGRILWPK